MTEIERSPAAILEQHSKESLDRINKIDGWVHRVAYGVIGLAAITLVLVLLMGAAFTYLTHQIGASRYETAVKGCQINRQSTHDGLAALMASLSKTEEQKLKSRGLADTYFPYDRAACEEYAKQIGLEP
jgi:hypothetical protein